MEKLKKSLGALFFVLIAFSLFLQGCATNYTYTSEAGRQCYYQCLARYSECDSRCFNNLSCTISCIDVKKYCLKSCPDLYEEGGSEPRSVPQSEALSPEECLQRCEFQSYDCRVLSAHRGQSTETCANQYESCKQRCK